MIKRFFRQKENQPVMGFDIDKPRITPAGFLLIFLYLAVPAMLIGAAIDLLIQLTSGRCVGIWCLF